MMLSPTQATENQPTMAEDSKPSLTIYAHQIASQTTEVKSLLTSSLSHISQEREDLRQLLKDTRDIVTRNEASSSNFELVLKRLAENVSKQESTLSFLTQTLITLDTNHNILHENINVLYSKLDEHNDTLQSIMDGQKSTTGYLQRLNNKLDKLQESLPIKNVGTDVETDIVTDSQRASIDSKLFHLSTDTIPTLPAPTGQPPVLSDSESCTSIVIDTPTISKRPTKKVAQSDKIKGKPRRFERSKRYKKMHQELVVEPTPEEPVLQPTQDSSIVEIVAPIGQESRKRKRGLGSPIIPYGQSQELIQNQELGESQQPKKARKAQKKGQKKRILAGPATQEEWQKEMNIEFQH